MNKSMTQNFLDNYLNYDDDFTLIEISKEQYDVLYKDKIRSEYFYQQRLFYGYDNVAHPLLKVHIIEDDKIATNLNGDFQWWYIFIFKHKGKFYCLSDVGEI